MTIHDLPDLYCPNCLSAELEPAPPPYEPHLLHCPSCSRAYDLPQLHSYHVQCDLAHKRELAREATRDVYASYRHDQRRRGPGGSDDGMATVPIHWLEKGWDDGILHRESKTLQRKDKVLQVNGLHFPVHKVRAALAWYFELPEDKRL